MSDIHPYGSEAGTGYYWVRRSSAMGPYVNAYLSLIAIDATGTVTDTGNRMEDDPAALSEGEAVREHLSVGISQANAHLEKLRKAAPPPEEKPPPMSPETARFFDDGDY